MFRPRMLAAAAVFGIAAAPSLAIADEPAAPIYAISDVHGAYEPFVELLRSVGLVDDALQWTGERARLVVVGDVLDRGARSRDVLELVMTLQRSAADAGGAVHFVLGNHEVMNLVGDLGYVSAAEYAAFADEEDPAEREAAWQRFAATAARADVRTARAEFDARYPSGFFAHRAAFGPNGRYGQWLVAQPVLLVLDGTAFVHGGLPEDSVGKTAAEINDSYARTLRDYLTAVDTLERAGVLHVEDAFAARPAAAARFNAAAEAAGTPPGVRAAIATLDELTRSPLLGPDAVFWYRGTVACSAAGERPRLERALRGLGAERLIVGHTPTAPRAVLSRFDRQVIRVDTGMLREYYGGEPAVLVVRDGEVEVLYAGNVRAAPEPQAETVAAFAIGAADDELERWLGSAPIVAREPGRNGVERLTLDVGGRMLAALFLPADDYGRASEALREVAAYRLDRMLELALVPTAVLREVDGRLGAVLLDTSSWPDERARRAGAQESVEWCPLGDQYDLMYVFDALTGSGPRDPTQLRYVPASWQVAVTGNGRLFNTREALPEHLRNAPLRALQLLADRLRSLSAESLGATLGDVLDERRRGALLARRDRLLELVERQ